MNVYLRNSLAVIFGWLSGSVLNMGLVKAGHIIYPINGIDPNNLEALKAVLPNLDIQFFIFPFLAHSLGTLLGAIVAGTIAKTHKVKFSFLIGLLFFIGGVMVNMMIGGPIWFIVLDLSLAYFPMAWIATKIIKKTN